MIAQLLQPVEVGRVAAAIGEVAKCRASEWGRNKSRDQTKPSVALAGYQLVEPLRLAKHDAFPGRVRS